MSPRTLTYPGIVMHLVLFLIYFNCAAASFAQDLAGVVSGVQRRYAFVKTLTGEFKQIYRAPGIDQTESGIFRLKKPGLMRWEYRDPEEKLFVADGRESFLYVPRDRQVTVQPFSASDLHNTPLELLLGAGDINKSFVPSWETDFLPRVESTYMVRLTPRERKPEYSFIVLELDQRTYDVRRILIREAGGNTSEFLLTNVATNLKLEDKEFKFKPPKGIEVIRIANEQ
jgi:outer membrane lipoprotein carrier protein